MKKILFLIIICSFSSSIALAEPKKNGRWSKSHTHYNQMKGFQPYLENSRHVQVPQWEHENWYLEDWFTQEKGMDMVKGFYKADIFRDQFQTKEKPEEKNWLWGTVTGFKRYPEINNHVKTLVVGPNFYHLSGFDKRRAVAVIDATYGVTEKNKNATFILEDWNTKRHIGVYDKNGLRLH